MLGGIGSGRPSGFGSGTVESNRSIDANRLQKEGCLDPGWTGNWEWKRNGERVALISLRMREGDLLLDYNFRRTGEEWKSVSERVSIARVPCRFGGTRPYFECPGVVNGRHCGRRVIKLYGAGTYFLCRHCYQLSYQSQAEDDWGRVIRRRDKLRHNLESRSGAEKTRELFFPHRPKGMHHKTYERLLNELEKAEDHVDAALIAHGSLLVTKFRQITCVGS